MHRVGGFVGEARGAASLGSTLIKQLQRSQFGRRSEQLDADQLQLGLEDLEQAVAAVTAAQEAAGPVSETSPCRPPTRRNRGALPSHLPRIEVVVDVEDKTCPCCGEALHVIGEDRSEMLDVIPAQYRVKVIRRPRWLRCWATAPSRSSSSPPT